MAIESNLQLGPEGHTTSVYLKNYGIKYLLERAFFFTLEIVSTQRIRLSGPIHFCLRYRRTPADLYPPTSFGVRIQNQL